jgi:hypothetical protein
MRAALINDLPGSYGTINHAAIWEKVARYNLDTLLLDIRQLQQIDSNPDDHWTARQVLDRVREKGKRAGVVLVPTDFDPDLSGEQEADYMADFVDRVGYRDLPLTAVFDDERHDPAVILDMLAAWRGRKRTRKTIWSPEGMQAGWFTDRLVQQINADANLWVARQNYAGNMYPFDADRGLRDLLDRGVKLERCEQVTGAVWNTNPPSPLPFPIWWSGIIFTLELLA